MSTIQFTTKDFVYPKKRAWDLIILDIQKAGLKPTQIATLIGVNWSTFQNYTKGTEPKHSVGESILVLHDRYVKK